MFEDVQHQGAEYLDVGELPALRAFEIPRWRESDGLRRLLAAFERVLPLRKPSDLARREILQFVLGASGGLTGEISTLLNNAAELSIRELVQITDIDMPTPTRTGLCGSSTKR